MKKLIILILAVTGALAGFSQTGSTPKVKHTKHQSTIHQYTCPMHPDVVMNKSGKCSTCGMDLQASKKENMKMKVMKTYTCPMHPDVVMDKPGKCSACGMKLQASKKEKMKMEVMKTYTCPMHPGEVSDNARKCGKCGMDLTESKTKSKTKRG